MSDGELVEIRSLAAGGDGVGRLADGRVVFVPWSAPGDLLRLGPLELHKRFARGSISELVHPGPDRREPPCPVAGRCGGCRWQHIRPEAQREARAAILRETLQRLAGVPWSEEIRLVPSPELGYRGRARVQGGGGRVGFRKLRSHALCGISHCPVLSPGLDRALGQLAADPPTQPMEWLLAEGDSGEISVWPRVRGARAPAIEIEVAGDRLRIGPGVFFQAHATLRGTLAEAVWELAGSGGRAVELYAGAGFFTLGLARRFSELVAVESDPRSVRDLRFNLARAGHQRVRVEQREVASFLRDPKGAKSGVELLVLDPPRTGLPRDAAAGLAALGADRIVYVSCDPATLARDLRVLVAADYRPTALRALDLFPQTAHLETVVRLDLGPRG